MKPWRAEHAHETLASGLTSGGDTRSHPRRAILYIAWGMEHLARAVSSARSAAFMKIPSILHTDESTASLLTGDHPFARVTVVSLSDYSLLAKCSLMDGLPEAFDSFLYLDADTVILKDITFGFEMAERHGMAMAPASHYSLDHFWGFARVMAHVGMPLCGQLQYNTGVIFFTRRPDVMEVLRTWKELAFRLIDATQFKRTDQPFLTLAMETLRFNPYTLAPTYNYRALAGEPISGEVRVWHSKHPVPRNINTFDRAWPPRAYLGTKRLR